MKLAVIGQGRWGTNIINTLSSIGGHDVVVLDRGDSLDPTSAALHHLDGVLVATPGSTHADIALPFIEKGIATFIEKPLATTVADAERLQAAAVASGAIVSVGHVHLYNPAYQTAKSLVASAGTLRYLYAEGTNNGPFRDDMSALWDWAPHDVAMAIDIIDALPTSVEAWGINTLRPELTDTAMLKLTFLDAVTALIAVSWLMPEKRKKLMIIGSTSSIVYDDTKSTQKVTHYQQMGPAVAGSTVTRQEPALSYPDYDATAPLTLELQAFVQSITNKKPTPTPLEQGVAVVRILAAAEESIALDGKPITV